MDGAIEGTNALGRQPTRLQQKERKEKETLQNECHQVPSKIVLTVLSAPGQSPPLLEKLFKASTFLQSPRAKHEVNLLLENYLDPDVRHGFEATAQKAKVAENGTFQIVFFTKKGDA